MLDASYAAAVYGTASSYADEVRQRPALHARLAGSALAAQLACTRVELGCHEQAGPSTSRSQNPKHMPGRTPAEP
jgi:hypothetical protein